MGYKSVSFGWVYSRVSLSVWPLAVVRLAFTDKIRLTGQGMLLYLCWLLFQRPTAVKQANFASQRIFTVVHTQSLYATLSRAFSQLGENSSAGHVFSPFFHNTSFSLFDFILRGCCKVKKQISQQSSTGSSLPLCILFILNFPLEPTENAWQREPGAQKSHYFFALRNSFIQWGINETITKLSWKFEENRTSGRFYFFKQKKNIRNGIHCIELWANEPLLRPLYEGRKNFDKWTSCLPNVGKYQNGPSYTRVSARHNWDARAPLWVSFAKGALVGTRLREGGHCACASFASSTTEITRSSCGRVELTVSTCVTVQHWWSVLLTCAQAHACKQRLAWETPRGAVCGGTSLILSSVFLSCWILEALGGVFRSWWRSLFGDRRLLAYSVMTVVACWTGCVDGRRTWSHLRSSATWKDGLSGGGKRGAGGVHLKRELS